MIQTSTISPRTFHPAPKPEPTAPQRASAERTRQLGEQADALYAQLFEAMRCGHRVTTHHVIDRMLDLRTEYEDVLLAAQADAGEGSQWGSGWEHAR